ncbi:ANTAR domain-containing protein [Streptomyces armeniacus]|uniref:ANTAR domain-containing protein n=1 Tax=Streptomyces armeniacus TaxID=83291 RepID=A0A345XYB3_9ACTN|nr:GAF and ANTAR domain-containing protein [Streptomyces armeniacus]AXK36629.1 ANTAR domain-containing protein [Streptomyces armeniacus]
MHERRLATVFVELADNLVADFDLIDFLWLLTDRSVRTLDIAAAGLLLADTDGQLRVMAASSDEARLMELLQLQHDSGPCLTCYRTAAPVVVPDLAMEAHRWPRFAEEARRRGYTGVQAVPMRLRDEVIGALNLFHTAAKPFAPDITPLAQALADVATISVLQQRGAARRELLNEQLENALQTRVVIEQAKGKLAERLDVGMEEAFTLLRAYARSHNRRLSELAAAFVEGTEALADLRSGAQPPPA